MAYGLIGGSKSRYAPGAIRSQPMLPVSYSEEERRQIEELQQRPLQFRKEATPQTSTQSSATTQYPQKMGGLIGAAAPRQRAGRNMSLIGATMQDVAAGLRGGVGNSVTNYLDRSGAIIGQDKMLAQIDQMGISDPTELAFARANPQEYLATRFDDSREQARYDRGREDQLEDVTRSRGWQVEDRDLGYDRQDERYTVEDDQWRQTFDRGVLESDRDYGLDRAELAAKLAEDSGPGALTPMQKKVDEKWAGELVEWAAGGSADYAKQLRQLDWALERLNSGDELTGDASMIPGRSLWGKKGVDVQEAVEEVVQRNLRLVLGAQFTEKEGERLIKRSYNPLLDEDVNARRVKMLMRQMEIAGQQKQDALAYYEANGTMDGYSGHIPSIEDFDAVLDEADTAKKQPPEVGADGATIYTRRDLRVPDPTQRTGQQTGQYTFSDIESEIEAALGEDDEDDVSDLLEMYGN